MLASFFTKFAFVKEQRLELANTASIFSIIKVPPKSQIITNTRCNFFMKESKIYDATILRLILLDMITIYKACTFYNNIYTACLFNGKNIVIYTFLFIYNLIQQLVLIYWYWLRALYIFNIEESIQWISNFTDH